MSASRQLKTFWIGLLIYAVSFLLVAVVIEFPASQRIGGYVCALVSLASPIDWPLHEKDGIFEHRKFEYFSMIISGLINPVFLVFVSLILAGRKLWVSNFLRVIVPLMIPFCWVVFSYEHLLPREGHFLWIVGIVLVLFSAKSTRASLVRHREP
jgi:hypothetical protein